MTPLELVVDESRFGSKAFRLGEALRAGFNVPHGFALGHSDPLSQPGPGPWAVRSSAIGEDSKGASFAGQHETVLNVHSVEDAVRKVRDSVRSPAALEYRKRRGVTSEPKIAVIIQKMVPATCAGVLFTRNPNGADERVIEASWGLGESVVSGLVTPDHFRFDASGRLIERILGVKDVSIRPLPEGGTEQVSEGRSEDWSLDEAKLARLLTLGEQCESQFGKGQDIEWAFAGDDLFFLQCRPITHA